MLLCPLPTVEIQAMEVNRTKYCTILLWTFCTTAWLFQRQTLKAWKISKGMLEATRPRRSTMQMLMMKEEFPQHSLLPRQAPYPRTVGRLPVNGSDLQRVRS